MRVVVTGGVRWTDSDSIEAALDELRLEHPDLVVLTGMADGADAIARAWAERHGVLFKAERLDASLGEYPIPMHAYNEWLLRQRPHLVLAFKHGFDPAARPLGHEPGTEHMVRIASEAGVVVVGGG